jgi:lipopolysaccharide transport system permease protein
MANHHIVIEPGATERNYWSDLWQYRSLLFFLAWKDVMVRYKQTSIGIAWSLIRPLITIVAMWFLGWLFSSKVPDGTPRVLMVCAATLPWTFFASAFSDSANSLIANSNLLTKVYFPRLIIPVSTVIVCLIDFVISFVILLLLMLYFQFWPGWEMLLLPVFLLLALIAALGSGIFIAALNVKYRDFRYIIPFIVQFGLYLTPVAFSSQDIYSNTNIPEALKFIYSCNPMVAVVDGFRFCILGSEISVFNQGFFISLAVSILILIIGLQYFRKTERGFADII